MYGSEQIERRTGIHIAETFRTCRLQKYCFFSQQFYVLYFRVPGTNSPKKRSVISVLICTKLGCAMASCRDPDPEDGGSGQTDTPVEDEDEGRVTPLGADAVEEVHELGGPDVTSDAQGSGADGSTSNTLSPGSASNRLSPASPSNRLSSGPASNRLSPGPASNRLSPGPASNRLSSGPTSNRLSTVPSTSQTDTNVQRDRSRPHRSPRATPVHSSRTPVHGSPDIVANSRLDAVALPNTELSTLC